MGIKSGLITSIQGPFPCGEFTDQTIFNLGLASILGHGERVVADDGYGGPLVLRGSDLTGKHRRVHAHIPARQKHLNGRLK